jgi:hypothetical protein
MNHRVTFQEAKESLVEIYQRDNRGLPDKEDIEKYMDYMNMRD